MRRLATLVAFLLLFSGASPLLACMADRTMTCDPSPCCRAIQHDCGDRNGTARCRVEIKSDAQPHLASSSPVISPVWTRYERVPLASDPAAAVSRSLNRQAEHSPPGLILTRTANLRI